MGSQRSVAHLSASGLKVGLAPPPAEAALPAAAPDSGHRHAPAAQPPQRQPLSELSQLFDNDADMVPAPRPSARPIGGRGPHSSGAWQAAQPILPPQRGQGGGSGPRGMGGPQTRPFSASGVRPVGSAALAGKRPVTSMAPPPRGPLVRQTAQGGGQQGHVQKSGLMGPPAMPPSSQTTAAYVRPHVPVRTGLGRPAAGAGLPQAPAHQEDDNLLAELLEAQASRRAARAPFGRPSGPIARPADHGRQHNSASFTRGGPQAPGRPASAGPNVPLHRPHSAGVSRRPIVPLPADIFVPVDRHLQAPASSQQLASQLGNTDTDADLFGLLGLDSAATSQARTRSGFAAVTTAVAGTRTEPVQGAFGIGRGVGQSAAIPATADGSSTAALMAPAPQQQTEMDVDEDDASNDMHHYSSHPEVDYSEGTGAGVGDGGMNRQGAAEDEEQEDEEGWGDLTEEMRQKLRASKSGKPIQDIAQSGAAVPVPLLIPGRDAPGVSSSAAASGGHARRRQRSPLGRADSSADASSRDRVKDKGPLVYDVLLAVLDKEGKLCESNRRKLEQVQQGLSGPRQAGRASLGATSSTQTGDAVGPKGPAPFPRQACSVAHMGSQGGCLEVRVDRKVCVTGTCSDSKIAVLCSITYTSLAMQAQGSGTAASAGSLEAAPVGSQLLLVLQRYGKETFVPDLRQAIQEQCLSRPQEGQGEAMQEDESGTAGSPVRGNVRIRLFKPLTYTWVTACADEDADLGSGRTGAAGTTAGAKGISGPQDSLATRFVLYQGPIPDRSAGKEHEPAATLALGASMRLAATDPNGSATGAAEVQAREASSSNVRRQPLPLILCPNLWCFWTQTH